MATLRELLEQNKDKFVNGRLKVRKRIWDDGVYFEVVGISETHAVGFFYNGNGTSWSLSEETFELYTEPKAKKKLWPYLMLKTRMDTDTYIADRKEIYVLYFESESFARRNGNGIYWEYIGPVPGGEPIEVDE